LPASGRASPVIVSPPGRRRITSNKGSSYLTYAIAVPIIGGIMIFIAVAIDAIRVRSFG